MSAFIPIDYFHCQSSLVVDVNFFCNGMYGVMYQRCITSQVLKMTDNWCNIVGQCSAINLKNRIKQDI